MNKILEKYFIKTYPKIFRDMYGDPKKTCMAWGCACGAGWFTLLDTLCFRIQQHIDWHNKYLKKGEQPIPQLVAHQIKEKFGQLRFYHEGGDDYCQALLDFTEDMSYWICEDCGASGKEVGRTSGWIQSLCTECSKRNKRKITYNKKLLDLLKKCEKGKKK